MKHSEEYIQKLIDKDSKSKLHHLKYNMKRQLLCEKATKQNIIVSDEEVLNELKRTGKL